MKHLISVAILAFILMLLSCSDGKNYSIEEINGVKHYYNKNKPANENLSVELKKIRSLDLEAIYGKLIYTLNTPQLYLNDQNELIFRFCYWHKRDNYLTELNCDDSSFQQRRIKYGEGPEEIKYVLFLYETDSLILCGNRNKILSFDRDLKYISEMNNGKTFDEVKNIQDIYGIFHEELLAYKFSVNRIKENKYNAEFSVKVGLYDEHTFKEKKNLISFNVFDDYKEITYYKRFRKIFDVTYSKDEMFIAELDPERYKIHVYNYKGDKKYVANKSFRKIKFHENEIEFVENKYFNKSKRKLKHQYKHVIKDITADENGYLFVHISEEYKNMKENILLYDIFKDGVFIDRLVLESNNNEERYLYSKNLFFAGDKMINVGYNDDGNIKLDVYDYKIINK